ncbi:MAG TPA: glutamyl aminopeptidase [Myxococcales bacterium]|nr:glutamyl aminopeptidase [Deltaproteobacteria bacterium]HAA59150.1 glutamyl aminopeptidase [Myxococcales bacterium]|tara:strand:+ start:292 stop:1368 length:1077 start_codon:yes stop_codon:yes gene_type:complete
MTKQKSIDLLKRLTEAHGAPGHETELRSIFRQELGECVSDNIGNLVHTQKGSDDNPRVMITGHMDEVAFMVQSITADGLIRFVNLGGWWGHVLLAQRVYIQTRSGQKILGVITSKPPHFLAPEERKKVLTLDKMLIDVGATSAQDLHENYGIRVGDPIVPDSNFQQLHDPDMLLCKAFDNRCGVGLTIEVTQRLREEGHPNTVFATATVQEEVGTRGAQVAARQVKPDVAIVMEGTPADDLPGNPKNERQGVVGNGIQLRAMDPTAISNPRLVQLVVETAEEHNIKHQVAVRRGGGTDAKVIHLSNQGIPTIVLGVPARYIHTHNSIIHIDDYLSGLQLATEVIKRLDAETVAKLTDF